jgi:hypothetical protein
VIAAQADASAGHRATLPTLRRRLRQVRGRWYARFMLISAIWSAIAGLLALCGVELAGILVDHAGSVSGFVAFALPIAAAASICAAAGVVAVAFAPDDAALARLGDRRFSLQERLSTALETDNAGAALSRATLGPVAGALLADAEWCAQRCDPRQWFELALPRFAWIVPGLTVVAALLQLVPPSALGRAALTAETNQAPNAPRLTISRSADAAGDLRGIADLLAKDAERWSDPYLRTIARSLERLSEEVRSGSVDRRTTVVALDRLLQHARRAYAQDRFPPRGGNSTASSPSPADLIQSVLNDVAGDRAVATGPSARDAANTDAERKTTPGRGDGSLDPVQPSQRKTPSQAASQPATPQSLPPGWASVLDNLDDYERVEADPRAQLERAIAEQQRRMHGAVQGAGAAQDAGQGEGDRAGNGSRPLGNGGRNLEKSSTEGGEMLLPDQPSNGRLIRIEIPPQAVHAEVTPLRSGDVGSGWQRLAEDPVGHIAPTREQREALRHYFMRSAGGQGK